MDVCKLGLLVSSSSKDEISTLFLNRTMILVPLMNCEILFEEFGTVYKRLLLVYSNFCYSICRFFLA